MCVCVYNIHFIDIPLLSEAEFWFVLRFYYKHLIDFKGASTCQGLFYAFRLGNDIHCTYLHFFV